MARKRQPSAPSAEEMLRFIVKHAVQTIPTHPQGAAVYVDRRGYFFGPTLCAAIRAAMKAERGKHDR